MKILIPFLLCLCLDSSAFDVIIIPRTEAIRIIKGVEDLGYPQVSDILYKQYWESFGIPDNNSTYWSKESYNFWKKKIDERKKK